MLYISKLCVGNIFRRFLSKFNVISAHCFSIVAILSLLLTTSCSASGSDKIIVYFSGCADAEITSDILHSKNGIEDFARANGILIEINEVKNKCGYYFASKGRSKEINESLTDYDLLREATLFFEIK